MGTPTLRVHLAAGAFTAALLDGGGATFAESSLPLTTAAPQPGWREQQPEAWWQACLATVRAVSATADVAPATVEIISDLAGSVFLDSEREVIRVAILEGDDRGPHPILWLRHHQPIAFKRIRHLLQPADYLRLRLTGELATTPSDAARTGLFDLGAGTWDAKRCAELEISADILPPITGDSQPLNASPDRWVDSG